MRLVGGAVALSLRLWSVELYCGHSRLGNRLFHSKGRIMSSSLAATPPLIDVDCNLMHKDLQSLQQQRPSQDEELEGDKGKLDILQEDAVKESNIVAMLSPSSTLEEAKRGLALLSDVSGADTRVEIKTTVGIHPYHVTDEGIGSVQEELDRMRELLEEYTPSSLVAAVGECGLDYSEGFPSREAQLPWLEAQVQFAQDQGLPLFVHERLAFDDTIRILTEKDVSVPIIVHCFTGTADECQEYVQRGYYLSLSGHVLRPDGEGARQCLRDGLVPLDKLMIETDAPYMGFTGCRANYVEKQADFVASLNSKKRKRLQNSIYPNLPSSLPLVLHKIVECINQGRQERNETPVTHEQVAESTTRNAIAFFGFSKELVD